MDRVLYTTLETICGLISLLDMVESHFGYLSKESKGSFLSIKDDTMLECS
jgi:hypothetical protein